MGPSPGVQGELKELLGRREDFPVTREAYGGLFVPDQDTTALMVRARRSTALMVRAKIPAALMALAISALR